MPKELEFVKYINRFGAQSVLGRPLSYGEMKRIDIAENIYYGWQAREKTPNMVTWQQEHRYAANLLTAAEKLVKNGECS